MSLLTTITRKSMIFIAKAPNFSEGYLLHYLFCMNAQEIGVLYSWWYLVGIDCILIYDEFEGIRVLQNTVFLHQK